MRSAVFKGGVLALVAAVCAVGIVIGGSDVGFDWGRGGDTVSAQSNPRLAAASCGSGPLNGRTQVVVDKIMDALKGLRANVLDPSTVFDMGATIPTTPEYTTLTAIPMDATCSDITSAHSEHIARIGRYYRTTDRASTATSPGWSKGDIYNTGAPIPLNSVGLTQIRSGDFAGLSGVAVIQFWHNDLTTIPVDAFSEMAALTRLELVQNKLTSIPVGAFNGLGNLERLSLGANDLTTLPVGLFNATPNLESLTLSTAGINSEDGGNRFSSLPRGLLDGLNNLKVISAEEMQFTSDGLGWLSDPLPELTNLNLRTNRLTSDKSGPDPDLPSDIFSKHTKLEDLKLSGNRIKVLPDDIFSGLVNLDRLELAESVGGPQPLTTLQDGLFDGLTKLETIYANGTHLTSIGANVFSPLGGLEGCGTATVPRDCIRYIFLRDGFLTTLPDGLFGGMPRLERVDVDGNRLTSVPAGLFTGSTGLRTVDLRTNSLAELPAGLFSGLTDLRTLYLTDNQLETLPATVFAGLEDLRSLYLTGNKLQTLPATVFSDLEDLTALYLSENQLTALPEQLFSFLDDKTGSFSTWNNSLSVYLQENSLTTLPAGIFRSSVYVYRVQLTDNNISSLPATVFDGLTNLAYLYLGNNSLTSFPVTLIADSTGIEHATRSRLELCGNAIPASDITALEARSPAIGNLVTGDCPDTTFMRTVPTFTETEPRASCGAGHTLTGRTKVVVYEIMRKAWTAPERWKTLVDAIAADSLTAAPTSWPALSSWNTRYTSRTDDPAFCGLMTASDLARVESMTLSGSIESLTSREFAGLTSLSVLRFGYSWSGGPLRSLPSGVFDGLTSLRYLILASNFLTSLPDGIFDDLVNLRYLDLYNNFLASLPDGVFNNLRNLRQLNLSLNDLQSLPNMPFRNLGQLRQLWVAGNELTSDGVPRGTFSGMPNLRELHLNGNEFNSLPADRFFDQGLDLLRQLELGGFRDLPSDNELGTFRSGLPGLNRLTFRTGSLLIEGTPTPTPTLTPTLTLNERIGLAFVSRIAPSVREVTIPSDTVVNLSFELYNLQAGREDSLSEIDELRITWSAAGGAGTFSEPSGADGVDGDGLVDDRVVAWRAPSDPGAHTVTAGFARDYVCNGDELECQAVFNITVVRAAAVVVAEPTPCPTPGLIPTSLTDDSGNAYAVFTPAEGGEFTGEGVSVSAGKGALDGCGIIGIRAAKVSGEMTASHPGWTAAGDRYRVSAVNSQGTQLLSSFTTRLPLSACLPLPDSLRADISGVALLRELSDGSTQVLSSRVRVSASNGLSLCGSVSELPAVVIAASRGIPQAQPTPTAVVTPTTPDTGGNAPSSVAYVLLALVLGVLAVAGAVRLVDRSQRV